MQKKGHQNWLVSFLGNCLLTAIKRFAEVR